MTRAPIHLRASRLYRARACLGSVAAEELAGHRPTTPEAEEGNRLMLALRARMRPAQHLVAEEEDEPLVAWAHATILTLLGAQVDLEELWWEMPACIYDTYGTLLVSGRADCAYHSAEDGEWHVFELKFGRVPVPPARWQSQLMSYATSIWMHNRQGNLHRVRCHAIEPRHERVNSFVVTLGQAWEHHRQVAEIYRLAQTRTAALRPSWEACEHCAALRSCPAAGAYAALLPAPSALQAPSPTGTQLLSPLEVDRLLDTAALAGKRAELVREWVKLEMAEGRLVEGEAWGLDVRPGTRYISSVPEAWQVTKDIIPLDDLLGAIRLSVPDLEALVASRLLETGEVKSLKAGKEALARRLGGVLRRGDPVLTLRRKGKLCDQGQAPPESATALPGPGESCVGDPTQGGGEDSSASHEAPSTGHAP